ncbi:MAG: hypothetical protein JJE52_08945 [Acidimicrobiia bacterium]|nr:hypothetical protein [Acidimicrobiia bacterium]
MITYTVFEPDDATDLAYRWYGEATVYVHVEGAETDAFEVEGATSATPPTFEEVGAAVEAYHAAHKAEHPPAPPLDDDVF